MSARKGNSAAKASIGYTIGNYCIKGIGFITIPIFSRLLSTSDFGIYNTFLAYEAILYIFISLALHSSLKNAEYKFKGKIDQYTSSIAILPMLMALMTFAVAVLFREPLSILLRLDFRCILLLVLYSYCSGLIILYQSRIALEYNYSEYLVLSIFSVICNVGLSLLLIYTVFDNKRYMGRIFGGTAASLLMAFYTISRLIKKAAPKIRMDYWKYGLKISLPIIPHGLAQILLLQFDRIMINSIIGSAEAGLYSFAYTVYSLVQITTNSLDTVYSPWVFKQLKGGENKNKVQSIGTCFMLLIAEIAALVMLIAPEIIAILGGEKYAESFRCVLPVLLAGFFAMAYCIPSVMEYYHEKTKYIALGTTLAAIVNIILNSIYIPRYGYVAAAYTTLASYLMYFTLHLAISRKLSGFYIIKMPYLFGALGIVISAFTISFFFKEYIIMRLLSFIVFISVGIVMIWNAYGKKVLHRNWSGTEQL